MNYEVKTKKGLNGWTAASTVELCQTKEGQRVLELETRKVSGGLAAFARVFYIKNTGGFYTKSTMLFGDYEKGGIAATLVKRVTEKTVSEVHARALRQLENLIDEAKAFYEEKDSQPHN
ncbi:hypothetical protein GC194_04865 [bacterium]|nr:hypothetical protein [bacterium]